MATERTQITWETLVGATIASAERIAEHGDSQQAQLTLSDGRVVIVGAGYGAGYGVLELQEEKTILTVDAAWAQVQPLLDDPTALTTVSEEVLWGAVQYLGEHTDWNVQEQVDRYFLVDDAWQTVSDRATTERSVACEPAIERDRLGLPLTPRA